jgi:hypothetical protein
MVPHDPQLSSRPSARSKREPGPIHPRARSAQEYAERWVPALFRLDAGVGRDDTSCDLRFALLPTGPGHDARNNVRRSDGRQDA